MVRAGMRAGNAFWNCNYLSLAVKAGMKGGLPEMILFTGGAYQNKLNTALKTAHLEGAQVTEASGGCFEDLEKADVINHFHLYIRDCIENGISVEHLAGKLFDKNPNVCIVCDEMGSGIVPVDKTDRLVREAVGRVCCDLAMLAGEVYRVVCGIAVRIKQE